MPSPSGAWYLLSLRLRFSGEYGIIGEGRDGTLTDTDQFNPILYRKDKLTLIDSGTRWLSETPEIKYTKVPNSTYERIFTFAVLEENTTGKRFVFISTHFDHEGGQSDQASAFAAYISRFYDLPMFMCGDYNSSGVERSMLENGYDVDLKVSTLISLASALRCSVNSLFE